MVIYNIREFRKFDSIQRYVNQIHTNVKSASGENI